jgi:hypothetical protein
MTIGITEIIAATTAVMMDVITAVTTITAMTTVTTGVMTTARSDLTTVIAMTATTMSIVGRSLLLRLHLKQATLTTYS